MLNIGVGSVEVMLAVDFSGKRTDPKEACRALLMLLEGMAIRAVDIEGRDGQSEQAVVISTMTDPSIPQEELSALYWCRWNCELDLRSIKQARVRTSAFGCLLRFIQSGIWRTPSRRTTVHRHGRGGYQRIGRSARWPGIGSVVADR